MPESDFRGQLDQVHKMGLAPARQIDIDLWEVKPDREFNISGNFFYIKDAPGLTEYIDVKVNSSGRPAVSWSKQTGFIQPFNRLYITTPAGQVGTMKILIASEAPTLFNILDHRSAISEATQGILDQLKGQVTYENWGPEITVGNAEAILILAEDVHRKACNIQAKSTNDGKVYLGYSNMVTTTKWIAELQAGQSYSTSNFLGNIYGRADMAAQLVGYGEH